MPSTFNDYSLNFYHMKKELVSHVKVFQNKQPNQHFVFPVRFLHKFTGYDLKWLEGEGRLSYIVYS